MAKKIKTVRQQENDAAVLRPGAGTHGDRRTKRNRDRSSQRRNAIREACV